MHLAPERLVFYFCIAVFFLFFLMAAMLKKLVFFMLNINFINQKRNRL